MSYLELEDGSRLDIFGTGGGEQLAKESGVPFFGTIPIDPAVRVGGDDGKTGHHRKSKITRSQSITQVLLSRLQPRSVLPQSRRIMWSRSRLLSEIDRVEKRIVSWKIMYKIWHQSNAWLDCVFNRSERFIILMPLILKVCKKAIMWLSKPAGDHS